MNRFIIPSYNAPFLAVFCRVLRFKLANLLAERQRDTNSLKGLLREELPLIREVGLRPASFRLGWSVLAYRLSWCATSSYIFVLKEKTKGCRIDPVLSINSMVDG